MKIEILTVNRLPDLPAEMKAVVCSGRWAMYSVKCPDNTSFKYMLSTEHKEYMLSATGKPLSVFDNRIGIQYLSRVSFEAKEELNYIEISI